MNKMHSLHYRRKLQPRPTFIDPVVEVVTDPIEEDVMPLLLESVWIEEEIEEITTPIEMEDLSFLPDPVEDHDVVAEITLLPADDNDEIAPQVKRLWNANMRKAELLQVALSLGVSSVSMDNTKDEIIASLQALA